MKKNKLLACAVPLLFALATGTASAASLNNPDGGGTGGCGASSYSGEGWGGGYFANFEIPAIANGESVTVGSSVYYSSGSPPGYTTATFSCSGGILYYSGTWDYDYTWYGY
jgi:hypothetical protein